MGERYLTMAEIKAAYPDEWVLLTDATTRRGSHAVTGGCVQVHSSDRDEFDRRLREFPGTGEIAVLYTGKPDPNELLFLNLQL